MRYRHLFCRLRFTATSDVSIHLPPLKKAESIARGAEGDKSPLTPLFQRGGLSSYLQIGVC